MINVKRNWKGLAMLSKIWKNKGKILEGVWNSWFPSAYVERVAKKRESLCRRCLLYDRFGESKKAVIKGAPACSVCGCRISYLTRSLSSECSLSEDGGVPMWRAEMTEEEERVFNMKNNVSNDSGASHV
jgi:hypothetical protein